MTVSASPRLAVIGAGLIGKRHAELVKSEGLLSAIVDPSPVAADLAVLLDVPLFASVEALLAADLSDGAIVATPNQLHETHGIACMEAGLPVLIEKPLADTVAAGQRLVDTSNRLNVPLLVGHHRRHNPIVLKARETISAGTLGNLVAVHSTCWFAKPGDYFDVAWRRQPGGGPVLINLIHDIDLLQFFCGPISSLQAVTSNRARNFEVEDTAALLLNFASGVVGTMTLSDTIAAPWSWEMTSGENADFPHVSTGHLMIGGTTASLSLSDLNLWHHVDGPHWKTPIGHEKLSVDHIDPLVEQIRHFAKVIAGQVEPRVTGEDGLSAIRVVQAVEQAARSGKRIDL